jgi:hypothetical protein
MVGFVAAGGSVGAAVSVCSTMNGTGLIAIAHPKTKTKSKNEASSSRRRTSVDWGILSLLLGCFTLNTPLGGLFSTYPQPSVDGLLEGVFCLALLSTFYGDLAGSSMAEFLAFFRLDFFFSSFTVHPVPAGQGRRCSVSNM